MIMIVTGNMETNRRKKRITTTREGKQKRRVSRGTEKSWFGYMKINSQREQEKKKEENSEVQQTEDQHKIPGKGEQNFRRNLKKN